MKKLTKPSRTLLSAAIVSLTLLTLGFIGCSAKQGNTVEIGTKYGTMTVLLYDDTPLHRDNFLQLAASGAYDSLLFHRVIQGFMIQGGDPMSRNAGPRTELGRGEIGTSIEAEIDFPHHFHKRGALAAARKPDAANPERRSSGSQFYIVHGTLFTDEMLDEIEAQNNKTLRNQIFYEIQPFYDDSLRFYQERGMYVELSELQLRIMQRVIDIAGDRGAFHFSDSIRDIYKTQGGAPMLDGNYTVFGEIIDGFDVLDSIATARVTLPTNRPSCDIRMSVKLK